MLMLSLYTQGDVPYKTIYLHGLVRDKDRQKMSKSKGNVIDPLGVAEEYGADAIRLALLFGAAPGTDPVISEEKIRGMRNFATKLWNIARYIKMNSDSDAKGQFISETDADRAIKYKLDAVTQSVNESFDNYGLHLALETLYHFVWHDFADTYLEACKSRLQNEATKESTQSNLRYVLEQSVKLLHPFMPFVTEAIWHGIASQETVLMLQRYPTHKDV
jgi:valyl-tRNA synthetase